MKKDLLLALLAVALCTTIVIAVRQRREIADLKQAVQTVAAEQAAATAAQPPAPIPPPPMARPAPEPEPAEPAVAATTEPAPAKPKPAALFAGLGKMMRDPAMRGMVRAQQKMGFDMIYGSLFKYLNLPPDQLNALKDLLADRQMALMDASFGLMDGSVTATNRAQKAKELEQVKTSFDQQIAELLGAEDYAVFKDYELTQPERTQVNLFKQSLGGAESLTEDQELDLIGAMYEERQRFPESMWTKNTAPEPGQFTEEKMTGAVTQLEQMHAKYVERATAILTPQQLEQFRSSLEQQRSMMTVAMKMAGQMFGQSEPAPPAPAE